MTQTIIQYNVHLPLGAGGSRIGCYRTIEAARKAVAKEGRDDLQIWKTTYHKGRNGKLYTQGSYCVR